MSGLRPFYWPVELRFCVRPHSDIGVRFRPIFAVWKLDRLGRSVKSLIELVSELNSKNIHFKSLTDSIDTWLHLHKGTKSDTRLKDYLI